MIGAAAHAAAMLSDALRDGRGAAEAAAGLLTSVAPDNFTELLDATSARAEERAETGTGRDRAAGAESRRAEGGSGGAQVDRHARNTTRNAEDESGAEGASKRPEKAAARARPGSNEQTAADQADASAEADSALEAEADSAVDVDPDTDDALKDLLRQMQAATGATKAVAPALAGGEGSAAAARLLQGMRPVALASATPAEPTPPDPEPAPTPNRVSSQVLAALGKASGLGEGRGVVRLQLDPAHLGRVEVTVRNRGGQIEVNFRVESAAAEQALREHAHELGQAILAKGSGWTGVNVSVENAAAEDEEGRDPAAEDDGDEGRGDGAHGRDEDRPQDEGGTP